MKVGKAGRAKTPSKSKVYRQFSRYYDHVISPVYTARVRELIESLEIPPGANILEVGVGTGISLAAYPESANVVGIDLSEDMLNHAAEKIEMHGWEHIELQEMDALNLEFPDEQFDYVTAFHVVSVVPDIQQMMQEVIRVCKPGGMVAIINHFRSEKPWLAPLVDMANPLTRRLGWRTNLRYDELVNAAPLRVERRFKTSPASLFTVLLATKPDNC